MSNTTEKKAPRITKSQRFADIAAMLNGEPVQFGTTKDEALAVLAHEQELLAKKNSSGEKKMTKTQEENEGFKQSIVDYLATCAEPVTCATIHKAIPEFGDYSIQKTSALLRQLKLDGKVATSESKGKTLFALA